jgi:hypothetical protein
VEHEREPPTLVLLGGDELLGELEVLLARLRATACLVSVASKIPASAIEANAAPARHATATVDSPAPHIARPTTKEAATAPAATLRPVRIVEPGSRIGCLAVRAMGA